jgi:hypothetical protein
MLWFICTQAACCTTSYSLTLVFDPRGCTWSLKAAYACLPATFSTIILAAAAAVTASPPAAAAPPVADPVKLHKLQLPDLQALCSHESLHALAQLGSQGRLAAVAQLMEQQLSLVSVSSRTQEYFYLHALDVCHRIFAAAGSTMCVLSCFCSASPQSVVPLCYCCTLQVSIHHSHVHEEEEEGLQGVFKRLRRNRHQRPWEHQLEKGTAHIHDCSAVST